MDIIAALSVSIGLLAGVATWLFLGPMGGLGLSVWATFIAWASFYHCGGKEAGLQKTIVHNIFGAVIGWIALILVTKIPLGVAASVLYLIVQGKAGGYDVAANGFAQNGWAAYGVVSAFVFEMVATFLFLTVILSSTQAGPTSAMAGLVIGLTLVMIHLAGIAVSGSSVNPARSFGPALFAGPEALLQVWLYFVAPCLGAAIAGFVFKAGATRQTPVAVAVAGA